MGNKNSAALSYLTWDNASQDPNQPYADDDPIKNKQLAKSRFSIGKNNNIDLEKTVKLSLRLKKKIVQSSSFNTQQFPMLATLNVDNIKSSSKAPLDLVCVIDHSGSMSGEKIELVKKSFQYLLKYLGDSDRLSIVIFDNNASRLVPLVKTTKANKQKILASVSTVHGAGGTDINRGMDIAFNILKQRRQSNPVTSIFLLSDGLDGSAQHKVRSSLERIGLPEEITINTFGFGQDHDPQLMSDIAALRDGNFYFIKELNTVDEAFIDCLGGLLSSVAQSAEIRIQAVDTNVLPGVEIVKAYGDENMWIKAPQNGNKSVYATKLNNLISGRQKNFVLEVSIPINKNELQDHQKDIQIVKAEAEIVGLNGEKVVKTTFLHITLLNESEKLKNKEEDDAEVMKNFYRVKGASLIDEGRKLADQGRNDEAKKSLTGFKEELEHCFLKNEEFIKNMIKDIERAIENVNPVVYQQFGKIEMMSDCKAQMYEKSNLKSANCYQNSVQTKMLKEVKAMKKAYW